jgi:hypothetical protein
MEAGSLAERSCVGATTAAREAVGVMEASARVCQTIGLRRYEKKKGSKPCEENASYYGHKSQIVRW